MLKIFTLVGSSSGHKMRAKPDVTHVHECKTNRKCLGYCSNAVVKKKTMFSMFNEDTTTRNCEN